MSDNSGTTEEMDESSEAFWEIIDSFIDLANEHVKAGKGDSVSAAMSYAAARFNAFVVAAFKDIKTDWFTMRRFCELYRAD